MFEVEPKKKKKKVEKTAVTIRWSQRRQQAHEWTIGAFKEKSTELIVGLLQSSFETAYFYLITIPRHKAFLFLLHYTGLKRNLIHFGI